MIRLITFLALLSVAAPGFCQPLHVADGWINNLPPSIPVRAGYMRLMNPGSKPVTIVSVSSDACKSIEIHETVNNDGIMSMRALDQLVLQPNATITLEPGGVHLMLQPVSVLKPGDRVELTLQFDNNASQTILMTVKK